MKPNSSAMYIQLRGIIKERASKESSALLCTAWGASVGTWFGIQSGIKPLLHEPSGAPKFTPKIAAWHNRPAVRHAHVFLTGADLRSPIVYWKPGRLPLGERDPICSVWTMVPRTSIIARAPSWAVESEVSYGGEISITSILSRSGRGMVSVVFAVVMNITFDRSKGTSRKWSVKSLFSSGSSTSSSAEAGSPLKKAV